MSPKQIAQLWQEVHGRIDQAQLSSLLSDPRIAALGHLNPFVVRQAVSRASFWPDVPDVADRLMLERESRLVEERAIAPETVRVCRSCKQELPMHRFGAFNARTCILCRQAAKGRAAARQRSRVVSAGLPTLGKHR